MLQTPKPPSLTRLLEYGEINGTLNPIKHDRKTRGYGLVFSGDIADPDESEDFEESLCSGGDTHGPESK